MEVKNLQNQKGFTLVEIAIVLVIIGLLLGGVLKGQEMINSAKIKSDTDALVSLQASSYAYSDRIGRYPGDSATAAASNGEIVPTVVAAADAAAGDFFEDLFVQGFLKTEDPQPQWDEGAVFGAGFGSAASIAAGTTLIPNRNQVCIFGITDVQAVDVVTGIDVKLDDGVGTTGVVFFVNNGTAAAPDMDICLEL
ncbi:prepilin-type N-terminal cleavage/methylation domain-containing protein [Thiomicrorhabdus sp. Kp2]|uniref:prepilin-type N-terminal cleavage/methylation domain-containing protein n=1 Tax=Thiomicrorhabdus sp. Kp2 TaxID=1123518 RepID=UPI000404ED53|nr:prepilin-type N-terminal cleavage/methylation domain-containing protein [Thiomicrorhabdus sp. Kp2]